MEQRFVDIISSVSLNEHNFEKQKLAELQSLCMYVGIYILVQQRRILRNAQA